MHEKYTLHEAVKTGDNELVEYLLKAKADPNVKDNEKLTSLLCAAEYGKKEVIQVLLTHKADQTVLDKHGEHYLSRLIFNGHYKIIPDLLNFGININLQDNLGKTVLHNLVDREGLDEAEELNGNINAKYPKGEERCDFIEKLLYYGADYTIKCYDGSTPLHWAINDRWDIEQYEIIKLFTHLTQGQYA